MSMYLKRLRLFFLVLCLEVQHEHVAFFCYYDPGPFAYD